MKLKFKAKGITQPDYQIINETINGIDLSQFPVGGKFIGDESTKTSGIYDATRDENGELIVTLAQRGMAYECCPSNGSHDWRGTGELIDATEYNPNTCYIVATSKPEGAVYVKRAEGFTVALPEESE